MERQEQGVSVNRERPSPRAAIANAVVRIHAQHYGRGPTKARTYLSDDFALVVLEDLLTPVERTLMRSGRHEEVATIRDAFQATMREEFVTAVEEHAERSVRAFFSQVCVEPEMGIELFMFEPRDDDE